MSDTTRPSVYPVIRYDDAPGAIDFLGKAFQLTPVTVHEGPDGTIVHAQLAWRTGVIMVGSRSKDGDSRFETGRTVLYLAVEDPDAHHDHAVAAGVEVIMDLVDQPYGSREYAAVDPEGNVWSFGTYQPGPDSEQ